MLGTVPTLERVTTEPSVDEVYDSALAEHPEYSNFDKSEISEVISRTLGRIVLFEEVARNRLEVDRVTAENIGTIWVLSGTGNYDQPFKEEDNPKLSVYKAWMGGFDRARLGRGAMLARKIAESRSGISYEGGSLADLAMQKEKTKELIAEYGPTIVYNGYPVENEFLDKLLDREGIIIPREKVLIIDKDDLKITVDQIKSFSYSDNPGEKDKEVAIVSHAPHLARVLGIVNKYKPFTDGSCPYVVPVATPDEGRKEFALMEARGLLYYAIIRNEAALEPYPYQFIS